MAAGTTTNFVDHLRRRREEIGVAALADALDRLGSPCEDGVNVSSGEKPAGDADPLDTPFEELVA